MGDIRLTQKLVELTTCLAGRKDLLLFDRDLRGFGVRVTAAGGKHFLIQYRSGGKVHRFPLGRFGTLSVEQARQRAKIELGGVAAGGNPVISRKTDAVVQQAAERAAAYTMSHLVDEWAEARSGSRRASYLDEAVRCLRRNLSEFLALPASTIDTTTVVRELDRIKKTKGIYAANRTLAYGSAAYSWATRRQALQQNPFRGVERVGHEPSRERVLEGPELGAIWRACDRLDPTHAAFVRILMLTLQRRGEVAAMEWPELSPDFSTWTLPASRAKNGRTQADAHYAPGSHGTGHHQVATAHQ
ncbi:MAG: integrase family protein [Pseudomonadota bacterium]|nr:integrase family protein [Pseudomonadota bacterium]